MAISGEVRDCGGSQVSSEARDWWLVCGSNVRSALVCRMIRKGPENEKGRKVRLSSIVTGCEAVKSLMKEHCDNS